MAIIEVNKDNISKEHICCALSKGDKRAESKKNWMKNEFDSGLTFKKLDIRGKVFVEYIPIENAYVPVIGEDYMYINCFWISGKYKGQGYGNLLLEECIKDAREKNKRGLLVLSSTIKKPFLSEGKFFKYKGFEVADRLEPYYELLYLNFDEEDNTKPKFIKNKMVMDNDVVIFYTRQCPHNGLYIGLIKKIADENNIDLKTIEFKNNEDAKKSPNPFTTYSIYVRGEFITNEILSEKKFLKLMKSKKII